MLGPGMLHIERYYVVGLTARPTSRQETGLLPSSRQRPGAFMDVTLISSQFALCCAANCNYCLLFDHRYR